MADITGWVEEVQHWPETPGDHLAQCYADKRASYPPVIEREAGKEYHYRVQTSGVGVKCRSSVRNSGLNSDPIKWVAI